MQYHDNMKRVSIVCIPVRGNAQPAHSKLHYIKHDLLLNVNLLKYTNVKITGIDYPLLFIMFMMLMKEQNYMLLDLILLITILTES